MLSNQEFYFCKNGSWMKPKSMVLSSFLVCCYIRSLLSNSNCCWSVLMSIACVADRKKIKFLLDQWEGK